MEVYNVIAVIEVDGTPIHNYYSLELNQSFNAHHQFSIQLPREAIEEKRDFGLDSLNKLIGKVAIIRLQRGSKGKVLNEFKGIITEVSVEQEDAFHTRIILNGCSPTIILDGGENTTCFIEKDLKKICEDTTKDISGECKVAINPAYKKTIKYFTQYRESNFEFLNRLSAEFGEWFYYNGKELFFGKPSNAPGIDLISGEDVNSLQLTMKLLPLSLKTFSYQSKEDKTITANTPGTVSALAKNGKYSASESDKLFSPVITPFVRPRVENKSDLDNFLKIQKSGAASRLEVLSGKTVNPEIIPGSVASVSISKRTGSGFSQSEYGKFVITKVSHIISEDGKYTNTFESLPSAVEVIPVDDYKQPVAEQQIAIVKDNKDPENLGRIKVQMLWQSQNITTDWIRVMTSDAGTGGKTGKNRGYVFIPEVNDQVIVGFRYNDPDRPFVMGSLFHGKSATGGGKDNKIKTLSTNSGNTITLNDDKGSMLLEDAKGNSVHLDGTGKIIVNSSEQIELKTGDSSITLKKDGTILITGKMKVEIKSDQAVSIEGTQKVDVKGTNISAKANANLDLAANANLTAKATAQLELQGTATAKLSSGAMAEITAALVKIN